MANFYRKNLPQFIRIEWLRPSTLAALLVDIQDGGSLPERREEYYKILLKDLEMWVGVDEAQKLLAGIQKSRMPGSNRFNPARTFPSYHTNAD